MTVIPGFCFSNTDVVSGIIWPVISGLDTTATVIVPVLLLLLLLRAAARAAARTGGHRRQGGYAARLPRALRSLNWGIAHESNLRNDEDVLADEIRGRRMP